MNHINEKEKIEPQRQPKALYLIVCVQMWECFSFYGMRVLLVLYMINVLKFSDARAFGIFALYTGLSELGGLIGGMIADKMLGLRKAIFFGGWLIMAGHLTLALGSDDSYFFPALALIIIGSSLFSTNLSALLGLFYQADDSRREAGYTLFYAGINMGSLLASLICGYIGEQYGWHYGFGLAALGMLFGNIMLLFFGKDLKNQREEGIPRKQKRIYISLGFLILFGVFLIAQGLECESIVLPFIPWVCIFAVGYVGLNLLKSDSTGHQKLAKLVLYILGLSLFFSAEEQMGSSLMMFNERHAPKTFLGLTIPSSLPLIINPAVIILFGTLMNTLCKKCSRIVSRKFSYIPFRLIIPFVIGSLAFTGLAGACSLIGDNQSIPILAVIGAVLFISLAELMIGPAVYSFCSEITTRGNQGMVMGLVPIGFSLASIFGAYLSKLMAIEDAAHFQSLEIYREGFMTIGIILLSASIIIGGGLIFISKTIQPKLQDVKA